MLVAPESDRAAERARMVDEQLRARGVHNERVLRAMARVPRHAFVPEKYQADAYDDRPLPIGHGQTISQPYMVAVMTEALDPAASDRVLEVGTGSGYQAAVLAGLVADVTTVEWVPELADRARARFDQLGIANVTVVTGDGSQGVDGRPFDGIIVTAGAAKVPPVLLDQLADGGRLVMPIGSPSSQVLTVVSRTHDGLHEERGDRCVFVPLMGAAGWGRVV